MLADELFDSLSTHLFLAFDQHPEVDGETAFRCLEHRLERLYLEKSLSFIVHGATGVEIAIAFGGFERRCNPLIERVGGLDVVMTVSEAGGFASGMEPIAVNQGMTGGVDNPHVLEADPLQFGSQTNGSPAD